MRWKIHGERPIYENEWLNPGPPTEKNESDRVEWIPLANIRGMIDRREIVSSGSLVGLLYVLMDEGVR